MVLKLSEKLSKNFKKCQRIAKKRQQKIYAFLLANENKKKVLEEFLSEFFFRNLVVQLCTCYLQYKLVSTIASQEVEAGPEIYI